MSDDQSKIEKVYLWIKEYISIILSCGIAILFCLFILVMLLPSAKCIYMYFTGITTKSELLEFIGWGMGGFIATLGAVGLLRRAAELSEQNKLTEKGHVHERFKAATEHLGNEKSDSVRIASFNEFYRLAEITAEMTEEKGLRETIFDILCAHLRQTTKDEDYKNNPKPTEEVQSLLDILFKPKNKNILIFSGLEANLAEANLQGANLQGANLQEAHLQNAHLQNANLQGVNLQGAHLQNANLQGANLQGAHLQGAHLQKVNLQNANLQYAKMQKVNLQLAYLQKANLQEANMQEANLKEADMQEADMQKANLKEADMQYANLQYANLQKANLQKANLQNANLQNAHLQVANLQEAKMQYANLEDADLQDVNLQNAKMQGANLQEANLEEADLQGTHLRRQYRKGKDTKGVDLQQADLRGANLLAAKINITTTIMPDNWKSVVKLHEDEDGEKIPMVVLMNSKGEDEGVY